MGRSSRIALLVALLVSLAAAMATAGAASAGPLYAFGLNAYGQLGTTANNGTTKPNPTPMLVSLPGQNGQITQLAAGAHHSLALITSGQVYAFGDNAYGQLGTTTNSGTNTANPTPTAVALPGASGQVTQIATGRNHSLALTSTGQLYAFGNNFFGDLGTTANNGNNNPNPTPMLVALPGGSGEVTQISAGDSHSLALTAAGQLYAFGYNGYGQLGTTATSGTNSPNPTPTLVALPGASGRVTQIATGAYHSLALTSTGQLYAFGNNDSGQLGTTTNSGTTKPNPTPTLVALPGASGQVTQIATGGHHSFALTASGQLYAFGENYYGQLGTTTNNGTNNPNPTPALVALPGASGRVTQIAPGSDHSLALTSTGQLYAFGYNGFGQLGTATNSGTNKPNPTPTPVALPVPTGMFINALSRGSTADHILVSLAALPAPALSALVVSPRKTSSAGRLVKGRCVKPNKKNRAHKHCTRKTTLKLSYTLNTPAAVTLILSRQTTGRKVKGRCVKPNKKNRKHKHCKLTRRMATLTKAGTAGNNILTLSRKLKPGSYKLTLTATANGHTSSPQSTGIKVTG